MTHINIVGSGWAGALAAYFVARSNPSVRVRLIDRDKCILTGFRHMAERPGRGPANDQTDCPAEMWRGGDFARQLFYRFNAYAWEELLATFDPAGRRGAIRPSILAERLEAELEMAGVEILTGRRVTEFRRESSGRYRVWYDVGNPSEADYLILASGGGRSHVLKLLTELGHGVRSGGPAFLGLRMSGTAARGLAGEEWPRAVVRFSDPGTGQWRETTGSVQWRWPFLEGSAIARLTAFPDPERWRGKSVHKLQVALPHEITVRLDAGRLGRWLEESGSRAVIEQVPDGLSMAHWRTLLQNTGIDPTAACRTLERREVQALASDLRGFAVKVKGFRQWKDEFSEEGGLELDSWSPPTLESRLSPGLYAIGEMLDMDGEPGGTNLHLAAAAAWVVSEAVKSSLEGA